MTIDELRELAAQQRQQLAKLLRQHHATAAQLSVGDILLTPGAHALIAALMQRPEADVNARKFGVWLAEHVGDFSGLTTERKGRGRFYRLAHVVRLSGIEPGTDAVSDVVPVKSAPLRLRDAEAAADRAEQVKQESAQAVAPVLEPIESPELRRQLDVLAILQAAKPKAGWTLPRLQLIERTANIKLSAKHAGRAPVQWPCVQQHEVAPKMFPAVSDTDRPWPANGASIQLRPWRI